MIKQVFILTLILSFCSSIWSEKIRLKDGGVVRGKVISENDSELIIANEYGNITIEKDNIARRIKERSDIPSFKNSKYSFRKRSWTKYAFLGTSAVGLMTTLLLIDVSTGINTPDYALFSLIGFSTVSLTFAALDYFMYGRTPKIAARRFTFISPFNKGTKLIANMQLSRIETSKRTLEASEYSYHLGFKFNL